MQKYSEKYKAPLVKAGAKSMLKTEPCLNVGMNQDFWTHYRVI